MDNYSVQEESKRILQEHVLNDTLLSLPQSFSEAAKKVKFIGNDPKPFIPTPCKITESASALSAFAAAAGSAVASDRYGIDYQDIDVNTDVATLFLESCMLPTVKGKSFLAVPEILKEVAAGDLYDMSKPIHQECTNVYQTKDGKWYHLHGSMNAEASMRMMGVSEQDVTREEAIKIYAGKVAKWDAETIDKTANEQYNQAGVICNMPEEFLASEHGKIMSKEPLYSMKPLKAPRCKWPQVSTAKPDYKPLAGIRVIDFSRVIAAPVISKILAVLGAEVLKVTSDKLPDIPLLWVDLSAGKRDANIDLKTEEGKKIFAELVKGADVLVDGYRPQALQKLGFDSESLRKINPSLVYVRENCYGFKGPLSYRSGWQQISDCLVGISWLQGKFMGLNEPVVPLLPNSDYQTGLVGAAAILHALYSRTKDDVTFDIDVSLTQYNIWYYRLGQYDAEQQKALLARNEGLKLRHFDEMQTLLQKTHAAMIKARPDLFEHPEYFEAMSGREWGLNEDIRILVPPFRLGVSKLEYETPSGPRGRSRPEWIGAAAAAAVAA